MSTNIKQDLIEYLEELSNIRTSLGSIQRQLALVVQDQGVHLEMSNSMLEQATHRLNIAAFQILGLSFTLTDQRILLKLNDILMSQRLTEKEG